MSEPVQLAKSARAQLAAALNALQSNTGVPPELEDLAEPIAEAMGLLHRIERSNAQNMEGRDVILSRVRDALNRLQALTVDHPVIDVVMEAVATSLSKVHALARISVAPAPAPTAAAPVPAAAASVPAVPAAAASVPAVPAAAPFAPAMPAAAPFAPVAPAPSMPSAEVAWAAPQTAPEPPAPRPLVERAPPPKPVMESVPVVRPPEPASRPVVEPAPAPLQPMAAPPPPAVARPAVPAPQPAPVIAVAPAPAPAAALAPAPALQPAPFAPHAAGAPASIDVELGTYSASNFYKGLGGTDVLEHGGIFVATYKIPKIGATVRLRVHLPGDYEFHASAQVQWTREPGGFGDSTEPGFGARILQISQEGRQLVYRYARNREPLFYDDL